MGKYKKLILSQICALMAVIAIIMAYYGQAQHMGTWSDPTTRNYLVLAILLFGTEIKLLIDWLRARKKLAEQ